jgi:hypothetical protein
MLINKINFKKVNCLKVIALLVLIVWFSVFLLQKIDLVNSDLGRFIKNGQDIFKGHFQVLKTNFYSFTYPNYPFVNHHWATGPVFYLIWKIGGFAFLHFFGLVLILITFFIFFKAAERVSDFKTAFLLSIILIPLIAYRKEIRPELFSYFFSAIFFFILWRNRESSIREQDINPGSGSHPAPFSQKWLFLLPLIEFFWVNFHIYFFLGLSILGAFLLEKIIVSVRNRQWQANNLLLIFGLSLFAALLNPSGLAGALHPFYIYSNYGYQVLEEQPVWFLENLGLKNPAFVLFKLVFAVLVLSFVWGFLKNRKEIPLVNIFLSCGFGFMALWAVRNFALFGFFALPILAANARIIIAGRNVNLRSFENKIGFFWLCSIAVFGIFAFYSSFLPYNKRVFGLDLKPGVNRSAEFFKQAHIKGPIFNNYDIGGYLIYHLFPKERVFVDNRPEVYPASFFQKIYIPMQEKEEIWKKQQEKYNFQAIFFARSDMTPWGQKFLIERVKDENWIPVFVDNFAIIFLKKNNQNKEIIDKYQIPRSYFKFD